MEGAEDLLQEGGRRHRAAHLRPLAHVAREQVEVVQRVGVLDRPLPLHALLVAADALLLRQAEGAAITLARLAADGAVGVPLRDHHQLAGAEELLVHLSEGDVVGVVRVEERRTRRRVADLQPVLEVQAEGEESDEADGHHRAPPLTRDPDEETLDGRVDPREERPEEIGETADGEAHLAVHG